MTGPLPSLGSHLLSLTPRSPPPTLKTSFAPVDTATTGIKYGRITNIQCEIPSYGSTLAYHIITSHLLTEASQVAYVDTTGAFSAITLLKVLEFRLQRDATHADVRREAVEMLDRVQYMRTFDFDGVVETVAEVFGVPIEGVDGEEEEGISKSSITPDGGVEPAGSSAELEPADIIPDSEADSDEEIFWPIPPLPKHDPGLPPRRKRRNTTKSKSNTNTTPSPRDLDENNPPGSIIAGKEETPVPSKPHKGRNFGVIVFDNISRPLENLLEKGEVEANSTLTLLSQGLRSLARDQGIAILLLSTPTVLPPNAREQKKDIYTKTSSVFARIPPTEGLPRTLGSCLDHTIMVSRYPKTETTSHRRRSGGQDKLIIETVAERHGGGVGQWGGFTIKGDIEFVDLFDEGRKDEKNLDHLLTENERRGKGAFGRWSRD
ncbi:hypothetical protein TWF481_011094 [Arthrobotrys musiformis]|uniref:DNA recombination and repair protein Rad51-like C-terminal domain-containing protein n=1 Tax=Arthrobotrys musiformis TaxID=47236 RepID=A0AAV9VXA4_9PEZI